ncbi:fungal-specific transcription factor domain-containing protein [Radiomyces spectabilis]|uniref:fungal-specific transcription factor domain-containing protein n=1 Tax=Radiomyces spectabilis TaxID=64574 RepID=UPI00221FB137|nr:fungal-specific transcription factor domain-containing protein [Radiomyces spectabilis]KAI8371342.1 fungal-specific transcription factor domain-containing protein [Radiomyces spectabilis]
MNQEAPLNHDQQDPIRSRHHNTMPDILPTPYPIPPYRTVDIPRTKRTRSSRSCDFCRKRKIRCDGNSTKPCSSCLNANIKCVFSTEQKKRGPNTSYIDVLETRLKRLENYIEKLNQNQDSKLPDTTSALTSAEVGTSRSSSSPDPDPSSVATTATTTATAPPERDITDEVEGMTENMESLNIIDYDRSRYIGISAGIHLLDEALLQYSGANHGMEPWSINKVNEDKDEHIMMKPQEIEVSSPKHPENNSQNRFEPFKDIELMTPELADRLVQQYFTWIHPYVPMINKIAFLEQYYHQNPVPADRYLLYAVCAVGARVVNHHEGDSKANDGAVHVSTETTVKLRKIFRARADKVMEVAHKRSGISTIQTLLLLSVFREFSGDDAEDTSHWFTGSMAIRMAQDLGLHRNTSRWRIPEDERELRRRIWYIAYTVDRWVAAELGRPMSILDHEFDVDLPSPYELGAPVQSTCDDASEQGIIPTMIREAQEAYTSRVPVYTDYIHFITLGHILGQVLLGLHSPRTKDAGRQNSEVVRHLECSLAQWAMDLPENMQYEYPNGKGTLKAALACLCYSCVSLLLFRPFITGSSESEVFTTEQANEQCIRAANNILKLGDDLGIDLLLWSPWSVAATAHFQAAIIFLYNTRTKNPSISEQGRANFLQCAAIYQQDASLGASKIARLLLAASECFRTPSHQKQPMETNVTAMSSNGGDPIHWVHDPVNHRDQANIPLQGSTEDAKLEQEIGNHSTQYLSTMDTMGESSRGNTYAMSLDEQQKLHNRSLLLAASISTRPEDIFLFPMPRGSANTNPLNAPLPNAPALDMADTSMLLAEHNTLQDPALHIPATMSNPPASVAFDQHPPSTDNFFPTSYHESAPSNFMPIFGSDLFGTDMSSGHPSSELPLWDIPMDARWHT